LLAEYGIDLVAEYDTMSARRLWVLVQGLPENAAVWREDSWTRQDEMLASLLELTDAWGHAMIAVHGGKMKGNPKPLHVKRPWEPEPQTRKVFKLSEQKEMMQFFTAKWN
jgi:hypothetical protein